MNKVYKCVIAFLGAFFLSNSICMIYYHVPYWIDRNGNATLSIWRPGAYILQAKEGFGYSRIDANGYVNELKPLADEYIIVMGSSHTQGKEVGMGYRYTDILNDMCGTKERLKFYNIGADGHFFVNEIEGFNAAIHEFPKASAVILEVDTRYFSGDEYRKAMEEAREYSEAFTGSVLYTNMGTVDKIEAFIKEFLPYLNLVKKTNGNEMVNFDGAFGLKTQHADDALTQEDRYSIYYDVCRYLKTEYDGKIIFLYRPGIKVSSDGILSYSEDYDSFKRAIEDSGLVLVDAGREFQKLYNEKHVLPYGFSNTGLGKGHLNKFGHMAVANAIYDEVYGEK